MHRCTCFIVVLNKDNNVRLPALSSFHSLSVVSCPCLRFVLQSPSFHLYFFYAIFSAVIILFLPSCLLPFPFLLSPFFASLLLFHVSHGKIWHLECDDAACFAGAHLWLRFPFSVQFHLLTVRSVRLLHFTCFVLCVAWIFTNVLYHFCNCPSLKWPVVVSRDKDLRRSTWLCRWPRHSSVWRFRCYVDSLQCCM